MRARGVGISVVMALGLALAGFVLTRTPPAAAATDLAVGRPATADSAEAGRGAGLANDGDAATRWCAADGATGHWWQVDLGGTAQLTGAAVVWEFARNYRYQIAVSPDGSAWTTVADQRNSTATAQSQSDSFTAEGRYVRITVTGLAAGTWASIWSFSVFGTGPASTEPVKGVANSECADLTRLTAGWYYNWGLSGGCPGVQFVPMVWGHQKTPAAVTSALNQAVAAGHRTVLGLNEPDKADQSNMPVAQAVELWPHLTANASVRVGSPATSAGSTGQAWFRDFMTEVNARGLRVDFVAVHWYGWNAGSCDARAASFESYLRWVESITGDRPIWITEYGCMHQSNPDAPTVQAFYRGSLEMFARHPRVARYAWYPWITHNGLVDSAGALTPLGTTFSQAPIYR
ncbi:glycosyl hydrolase [Actinomycetes bacterium KLBMP 9797]